MPEFMKKWIETLTDEQVNELALWIDNGAPCEVSDLIDPRPALHEQWNVRQSEVKE